MFLEPDVETDLCDIVEESIEVLRYRVTVGSLTENLE